MRNYLLGARLMTSAVTLAAKPLVFVPAFALKHTRFIIRNLPQLVERSVGRLMSKWDDQDKRIAAYKESRITDMDAHDLFIRSVDVGVCSDRLTQM